MCASRGHVGTALRWVLGGVPVRRSRLLLLPVHCSACSVQCCKALLLGSTGYHNGPAAGAGDGPGCVAVVVVVVVWWWWRWWWWSVWGGHGAGRGFKLVPKRCRSCRTSPNAWVACSNVTYLKTQIKPESRDVNRAQHRIASKPPSASDRHGQNVWFTAGKEEKKREKRGKKEGKKRKK